MTGEIERIAAEVERLEGPSREMDRAITALVWKWAGASIPADFEFSQVDEYTSSLDAAMTLVPEGHEGNWSLIGFDTSNPTTGMWQAEVMDELADATTPALALVAAALKARAHLEQDNAD